MVLFAKQYCPLWAALLFLLILDMAAFATDKNPTSATNDILRRLGHEPITTQANQNKNVNADKNESSSETDFERPVIEFHTHTVKTGESLSVIAKLYYDDYNNIALIAKYNDITDINQLKVGQKIKIPILNLKQLDKVTGFQEKNLAESKEIETSPIEENDLREKKSILKNAYLLIAIVFVLCFLIIVIFLLTKRSDKQVTAKTEEPIERASFVFGKAEASDNSGD